MSKGKNTVTLVRQAVTPFAEQLKLDLWDIVYVKEGPHWFLRIFIDKPGGVCMQDCEDLSRAIDSTLDELDPCDQEYFLEVSSPGLSRVLRNDAHLAAYIGKPVRLRLYREDKDGNKEIYGELSEHDKTYIGIKTDIEVRQIIRKDISEIRADDDRGII